MRTKKLSTELKACACQIAPGDAAWDSGCKFDAQPLAGRRFYLAKEARAQGGLFFATFGAKMMDPLEVKDFLLRGLASFLPGRWQKDTPDRKVGPPIGSNMFKPLIKMILTPGKGGV